VEEHSQIDLIPFRFTTDHFDRIAASKQSSYQIVPLTFYFLNFLSSFYMVHAINLHLIIGQCSRLIKTEGFHSPTSHSFLALRTHNAISVESHQAEGIGEVEIDREWGRKRIGDEVEETENDHDCLDLDAH
jgi:hypothetical protein